MNGKPDVRRYANGFYIPLATRNDLARPSVCGERHTQAVKIAVSLIGHGLASGAVFAQLRSMYGSDFPDKEIADIIRWASGKMYKPCHFRSIRMDKPISAASPSVPPIETTKRFLRDTNIAGMSFEDLSAELWEASSWQPLENWRMDSLMFFAGQYHAGEKINIVTDCSETGKPRGYGETLERNEWMRRIRDHGTPNGPGGAWVRMNPVDGKGISDVNVTSFRFALLEIDDPNVPLCMQVGLYSKLRLPVAALMTSGRKSIHCWVRLDAKNAEEYQITVREIHSLLGKFGIDSSNKNPSRMSRLPGVQRIIGVSNDGRQRLLYFNPDVKEWRSVL